MVRSRTTIVGVLATVMFFGAVAGACSSSSVDAPAPSVGAVSNRVVPAAIRDATLTNQDGRSVTLASWPGKTVLLVPFLTLCSDICPMTTGNLVQTERALRDDKAASKIEIVELSVDPGRDTPARLSAYAQLTGADWELVTESPVTLQAIAKFFGFVYQKVPEDDPPDIDWWTGQPLTYDIDHSDGFVVINPNGVERFVTGGAPDFHGKLDPTLQKFLSPLGREHLADPPRPSYTPADILQALAWVIQVPLPARGA